jgi:hypothetical protein
MRYAKLTAFVTLSLALSCSNCTTAPAPSSAALSPPTPPPPVVVRAPLPAPPLVMGRCPPSQVTEGMAPNAAFDLEHASFKQCSRQGAASRVWYENVRKRYANPQ